MVEQYRTGLVALDYAAHLKTDAKNADGQTKFPKPLSENNPRCKVHIDTLNAETKSMSALVSPGKKEKKKTNTGTPSQTSVNPKLQSEHVFNEEGGGSIPINSRKSWRARLKDAMQVVFNVFSPFGKANASTPRNEPPSVPSETPTLQDSTDYSVSDNSVNLNDKDNHGLSLTPPIVPSIEQEEAVPAQQVTSSMDISSTSLPPTSLEIGNEIKSHHQEALETALAPSNRSEAASVENPIPQAASPIKQKRRNNIQKALVREIPSTTSSKSKTVDQSYRSPPGVERIPSNTTNR